MAVRELNLSNIVEIKANKYGDVIKIDASDRSTVDRFANLIRRIDSLSAEYAEKEKALNEKYANTVPRDGDTDEDEIDVNQIIDRSRLCVESIIDIIKEFEKVFGEGCIRKAFRESYELNEDFIPDEYAISEFLDAMIPIMADVYQERFERTKQRYNTKRRGKHNKSKEELIKEYMGNA